MSIPPYTLQNVTETAITKPDMISDKIEFKGEYKALDIGCGAGFYSKLIADKVGSVVSLDIQDFMIDYAKQNYCADNITYVCADFMDIDLVEENFDIILASYVFSHIKEKEDALRKIWRLLKRGGQFIFVDTTLISDDLLETPDSVYFPASIVHYYKLFAKCSFANITYYGDVICPDGTNLTTFKMTK